MNDEKEAEIGFRDKDGKKLGSVFVKGNWKNIVFFFSGYACGLLTVALTMI